MSITTTQPTIFNPQPHKEIKSDGTYVNPADGVNTDGSSNIQIMGDKVIGPTLIATIPYSSFTASTVFYKNIPTTLNRNALKRTFGIYNNLNQPLTSVKYIPYDSVPGVTNLTASANASSMPSAGGIQYDTSESTPLLTAHVDSLQMALGMGATAPTSGNVYIYVTEVF